MAHLTDDMRRVLQEQRLGFVATVCPDGTPNLSPKGTTTAWDDEHLVFADVRSPQTVDNLRHNPALEVNVVDMTLRKGYRFKGTARVLSAGPVFDAVIAFYRGRGTVSPIAHVVMMKVERAALLTSPAYDTGLSESEVAEGWNRHWEELRSRRGLPL